MTIEALLTNAFFTDPKSLEKSSIAHQAKQHAQQKRDDQQKKKQKSDQEIVSSMSDESFRKLQKQMADSKVITSGGAHAVAQRFIDEKRKKMPQNLANDANNFSCVSSDAAPKDASIQELGGKLRAIASAAFGNASAPTPSATTDAPSTALDVSSVDMRQQALQATAEPLASDEIRRPPLNKRLDMHYTVASFMSELRKENSEPKVQVHADDRDEDGSSSSITDNSGDIERKHSSFTESNSSRSKRSLQMGVKKQEQFSKNKPEQRQRKGRMIAASFFEGLREEEQNISNAESNTSSRQLFKTLHKALSIQCDGNEQSSASVLDKFPKQQDKLAIDFDKEEGKDSSESMKKFIADLKYMSCEDDEDDGSIYTTIDAEKNVCVMRAA